MPRKMTAEDFQRLEIACDPQFAPDFTRIAFVKKRIDAAKSKYRTEIWLSGTESGTARRFTGGEWSDSSPRWSPDGKTLAFLSSRKKPESQLWLIASDGGEACPLTKLETEGSIEGIRWSPDGTKIAFLYRETPERNRKKVAKEREEKELPPPPRVHTRLQYRLDGHGYFDGAYAQIHIADVATGQTHAVTSGDFYHELPIWSPDSKTLAFLADRRDDWDILPPDSQIYMVSVEGGEPTLLPTPTGSKQSLAWSPDGTRFAYAGNPDPNDFWGTNNERLFVLPAEGGTPHDLTAATDKTLNYYTLSDSHEVGSGDLIVWTADSNALFTAVSERGDTKLCFITADGKSGLLPVSPPGEVGGFSITPDGRAAITLSTHTMPQELYLLTAPREAGASVACFPLTEFNKTWLSEVNVLSPETVTIPNGDGGEVCGWLLRPPDFEAEQQSPLVIYVHGGPHTQYGNSFFHELQWLAAEGYAVLYVNPRGSKGYGEAHTKAIAGDWGHADYRDILAATEWAASLPGLDSDRVAIMGGSYGGYLTAWAIGHTHRFACAIADRLVNNLQSMAGTCDFPWSPDSYFKGNAWSDPSDLWRCSPQAFAGNIETPLLLIHSDGDYRCPQGQVEELFTALRLRRKTVEFVRYPVETSHSLSRTGPPNLRLDRLQRNVNWLNRWLKP